MTITTTHSYRRGIEAVSSRTDVALCDHFAGAGGAEQSKQVFQRRARGLQYEKAVERIDEDWGPDGELLCPSKGALAPSTDDQRYRAAVCQRTAQDDFHKAL